MLWCFSNIVDGWCTRGLLVLILCLSLRVVLPLCGGNIDTTVLGRCLDRGLACDGRLLKFSVTVSDRPGGIAELCRHMASIGISIKDIMHERAWIQSDIFSVEVNEHIRACLCQSAVSVSFLVLSNSAIMIHKKAIPLDLDWPWGFLEFEDPRISRQLAHEGAKTVRPMHRSSLPPQEIVLGLTASVV